MSIVYLGAEVPSNRVILEQAGVTVMGVSFWGLVKRGLPKTKRYLLDNYFAEGVDIYVHAGLPHGKFFTPEEFEEFCADYEDFIVSNIDRITMFTEVQHPSLSSELVDSQRNNAWANLPEEKFGVVYDERLGSLESLATRYLNVFIPGNIIEAQTDLASKMRAFSSRHGTVFHALGLAKPELMRNSQFATVSTLVWLSPMMRGETIVWNSNTLVRYPKRMKDQARSRHKAVYEKAGLDFDKILADDAVEVSKLAIWSYKQLEAWNNRTELVTMSDDMLPHDNAETPPSDVTKRGTNMRKLELRNPAEIRTLPVIGIETIKSLEPNEDGVTILADTPVVKSQSVSLRICNTCFVKDNCPAFTPDSSCGFNIPVEVKTKDQLKGLINALLEIQGQRVLFSKFTEELNGGYPDPNVGQEMDRFFKMLETIKKLDESRDIVKLSMERQSSAGVLSALFGDRAKVLNELPNNGLNEQQTNQVIRDITDTSS